MTKSSKPEVADLGRHLACKHYSSGPEAPFVTAVLRAGYDVEIATEKDMALVFLDGNSARYHLPEEEEWREVKKPTVFFLDKEKSVRIEAIEEVRVSYFRFARPTQLCSSYSIMNLRPYAPSEMRHVSKPILEPLKNVLDTTVFYFEEQLRCRNIIDLKLEEAFFVISAYYKPEDIGELLAPLLRREIDFKEFVYQNFLNVDTVQDLADLRGLSIRSFNTEFKETFGVPPYRWMLTEKSKHIEERLADPTVPFSDIIEEFRFSSPSHFTVFCKRQFGKTPTELRRELIREEAIMRAESRRTGKPMIPLARRRRGLDHDGGED